MVCCHGDDVWDFIAKHMDASSVVLLRRCAAPSSGGLTPSPCTLRPVLWNARPWPPLRPAGVPSSRQSLPALPGLAAPWPGRKPPLGRELEWWRPRGPRPRPTSLPPAGRPSPAFVFVVRMMRAGTTFWSRHGGKAAWRHAMAHGVGRAWPGLGRIILEKAWGVRFFRRVGVGWDFSVADDDDAVRVCVFLTRRSDSHGRSTRHVCLACAERPVFFWFGPGSYIPCTAPWVLR